MLSCGALERRNNPQIELIEWPCFSKNQKRDLLCVCFNFEGNPEKGWGNWKKVSMSRKQNLCTCVLERKEITSLKFL